MRHWTREQIWELLCSSESHQYANVANYRSALAQLYWETSPFIREEEESR